MTLSPLELKKEKRISIPFYLGITNKIGNVFKRNDIQMVCSSSEAQETVKVLGTNSEFNQDPIQGTLVTHEQ
jgi:hypothetical protein